jgi:hypothetical protein
MLAQHGLVIHLYVRELAYRPYGVDVIPIKAQSYVVLLLAGYGAGLAANAFL